MTTQLEKARRAAGLSVRRLAKKSGVSISTISRVESGAYDIGLCNANNVLALARELNVTAEELVRGTEQEADNEQ